MIIEEGQHSNGSDPLRTLIPTGLELGSFAGLYITGFSVKSFVWTRIYMVELMCQLFGINNTLFFAKTCSRTNQCMFKLFIPFNLG